ncbi:MAG TPA: hypothetical protein VIK53_13390 [Verrucomicrobiae bacterium]
MKYQGRFGESSAEYWWKRIAKSHNSVGAGSSEYAALTEFWFWAVRGLQGAAPTALVFAGS